MWMYFVTDESHIQITDISDFEFYNWASVILSSILHHNNICQTPGKHTLLLVFGTLAL